MDFVRRVAWGMIWKQGPLSDNQSFGEMEAPHKTKDLQGLQKGRNECSGTSALKGTH